MSKTKINVYINKKTIPWNDRGFNYGDGLFETILIKNRQPIYLREHIKRLYNGCSVLKLPKPSDNLIKKNIKLCIGNVKECVVKIVLTRGVSDFGYKIKTKISPNIYFFKIKLKRQPINKKNKLDFSKYHLKYNIQLAKIKHLGRLEQVFIANDLCKREELDDLVVLDENNNLIECLSSNIFFVTSKNKEFIFVTPKINMCGIEGILRNKIINFLRKRNLNVKIIDINKKMIKSYESCFITNSIQGLTFINQIGKKKFSKPKLLYNVLKRFIYTNKQ